MIQSSLNEMSHVSSAIKDILQLGEFNREEELKGLLEAAPLVSLLECIPDEHKSTFIDKFIKLYLEKVGA